MTHHHNAIDNFEILLNLKTAKNIVKIFVKFCIS